MNHPPSGADYSADDAAFAPVFERKYSQLVRLARRILPYGQKDEAEDVVSVAFQLALEQRDQFRGEAQLSTWIYRICVNAAKEFAKRPRLLSSWMGELSESMQTYNPEQAYAAAEVIGHTGRVLAPQRMEAIRQWVNGHRDPPGTTSLKIRSWRSRRDAKAVLEWVRWRHY